MTSITQTITEVSADLARAGFSPAEISAIMAWKPYCSPEGCVCEKYADCAWCDACTGETAAAYEAEAAYWAEYDRQQQPLSVFMFGQPTEDDYHDEW